MLLRHAVDRGRRDEDDAAHPGVVRGAQDVLGAADVHRANRGARGLNRQRRRGVHDDVGAVHERADALAVADVAPQLLDRAFQLGVVQRDHVESAHLVPVRKQASCEVQAEKAGPTGYRPEHYF